MMIDTSLDAWSEVKKTLSERQQIVYATILQNPEKTTPEIARILGVPVRTVAPRITEMLKLGIIVRIERRMCTVTKGTAYTVKVV